MTRKGEAQRGPLKMRRAGVSGLEQMLSEYKTLAGEGTAELVEKRSRFIGRCAPVESEAAALEFVASIKAEHKTATHNVWAYSVRENNLARYTDDGEPQGTAGLPVLNCVTGRGLVDAAVVVTRYFGGTLLGKGGLVRAYSAAAAAAIESAGIAVMAPCATLKLACPYADYERVSRMLESCGAAAASEFAAEVNITATVRESALASLESELRELTGGRLAGEIVSRGFERLPD